MTTQTKRSRSQPLRGHSIDYSVRAHIAAAVNHYADTALTTQYTYTQCRRSQPLRGYSIGYALRTHNAVVVNHYADTALTTWTLAVNC